MKKTIISLMLLFSVKAFAQTAALPVYDCVQNGTQAVTSGLKSSNYQLGVVPYCSVSVYLTGTTTIATTTPQSPFRANKDGSIPPIYAAVNQGYDVVLSGGISPNVYLSPVTLTGLYPATEFISAGGISGSGTSGYIPVFTDTTTLGDSAIDQDVTTNGTVTIFDKGLSVLAQEEIGEVQFVTGIPTESPSVYTQTAGGISIGVGNNGFNFHSAGSGGAIFAAFNGSGRVEFNNSTSDGSVNVQINSYDGTCSGIFNPSSYYCGLQVNGGSLFNGPVEINADLGVTGSIYTDSGLFLHGGGLSTLAWTTDGSYKPFIDPSRTDTQTISGPLASTKYIGDTSAFSCVAGPAAGASATCVCATNFQCDTNNGVLTLTTTTPPAGVVGAVAATVTLYSTAQTPYPPCHAVESFSANGQSTEAHTLCTSTGFQRVLFGATAPAASTAYTIIY